MSEPCGCTGCTAASLWVRCTQFSDHYFCDEHARRENDFGKEDPSYFFWDAIPAVPKDPHPHKPARVMRRKPTHDWWPVYAPPDPQSLVGLRRAAIFTRAEAMAVLQRPKCLWNHLSRSAQDDYLTDAERHVEGWVDLNMSGYEHLETLLRDLRIALIYKDVVTNDGKLLFSSDLRKPT